MQDRYILANLYTDFCIWMQSPLKRAWSIINSNYRNHASNYESPTRLEQTRSSLVWTVIHINKLTQNMSQYSKINAACNKFLFFLLYAWKINPFSLLSLNLRISSLLHHKSSEVNDKVLSRTAVFSDLTSLSTGRHHLSVYYKTNPFYDVIKVFKI